MSMNPYAESGNSPPAENKSLTTPDQLIGGGKLDFTQVKAADIAAMSIKELDGLVDEGINQLVLNRNNIIAIRKKLLPAFQRMHDYLCKPGKRTDLNSAGDPTWTQWLESKKRLGSEATWRREIAAAGLAPLQLTEGEMVRDKGTGQVGEVVELKPNGEPKATVKFGEKEVVTVPTTDLLKMKSSVRNVKVGDLFLLLDKGAEYVYHGDGKFARTETPTLAQQKKIKEEADARKKKDAEDRKKEKAAAGKAKMAAASHVICAQSHLDGKDYTFCWKEITPETNLATGRITCKKCKKLVKKNKKAGESMGTPAAPPQAGEFDPPSPLQTSAPNSKKAKSVEPWKPFFARALGDKFTVFRGGEVEFTIRTAQGTIWDTMPEAEAHAGRLNAKYTPKAEAVTA